MNKEMLVPTGSNATGGVFLLFSAKTKKKTKKKKSPLFPHKLRSNKC
jgi:hypothetical protein